ncbi:TonB family protein [Mucilaginibacter celer]|uniref:TonB family protein n=1 Tax=Mucilaginibacter celer TaxID=2305508 RepID=A0A494VY00_9SPHI|nr:TonB family protein [Mucilaginibacter celer]AYL95872.1 TonB family protein [Mucilaginibacter celer]
MQKQTIKITEAALTTTFNFDAIKKFIDYITENLKYPEAETIEGEVVVEYTTDEEGKLIEAHIKQSLSEATDAEALRVIRSYTDWRPRVIHSQPKQSKHTIPLRFKRP